MRKRATTTDVAFHLVLCVLLAIILMPMYSKVKEMMRRGPVIASLLEGQVLSKDYTGPIKTELVVAQVPETGTTQFKTRVELSPVAGKITEACDYRSGGTIYIEAVDTICGFPVEMETTIPCEVQVNGVTIPVPLPYIKY